MSGSPILDSGAIMENWENFSWWSRGVEVWRSGLGAAYP